MEGFMETSCIKTDCLHFPMAAKIEPLCVSCSNFSEYHPTGTGRGLERTIDDEDDFAAAGIVLTPNTPSTPAPAPATPRIETCREATKRWKAAENEAKAKGDKARQKAIHAVLTGYLGNMSGSKTVELVDPLTAPIDQLSQIGRGKGITI